MKSTTIQSERYVMLITRADLLYSAIQAGTFTKAIVTELKAISVELQRRAKKAKRDFLKSSQPLEQAT